MEKNGASSDGGLRFETCSFMLAAACVPGVLTTCLADMTVQMKIPTETKAIDRYLLAEYLQEKKKKV